MPARELICTEEFKEFLSNNEEVLSDKIIMHLNTVNFGIKHIPQKKIIYNCLFKEGLRFIHLFYQDIEFLECDFYSENKHFVYKFQNNNNGHLNFIDCTFSNNLYFERIDGGNLVITNSNVLEGLFINNCKDTSIKLGETTINNITFDSSASRYFSISGGSIVTQSLNFKSTPKSINLYDGKYQKIDFTGSSEIYNLQISGSHYDSNSLEIGLLRMLPKKFNGDVLIKNAHIEQIDLSFFNNVNGWFILSKVEFNNLVKMIESTPSDVVFNDVDFSNASLIFDRSYIEKTVFSNVLWPKNHSVITANEYYSDDPINVNCHRTKQEIYRQLKCSCKNSSNNIEALKFYRNEMEEYWNYLKKSKSDSWADKILIYINKITSNFGQSYLRPLLWMTLIHSILFALLIITKYQGFKFSVSNDMTLSDCSIALGEYIKMLNPTHSIDEAMKGWRLIIDTLMRLSVGFFLYQIIRASRKFAKL